MKSYTLLLAGLGLMALGGSGAAHEPPPTPPRHRAQNWNTDGQSAVCRNRSIPISFYYLNALFVGTPIPSEHPF